MKIMFWSFVALVVSTFVAYQLSESGPADDFGSGIIAVVLACLSIVDLVAMIVVIIFRAVFLG